MASQTRVQKEEFFLKQADTQNQHVEDSELLEKMIAKRAYHIAEKRGFEPGREAEDWQEAKKELSNVLAFSNAVLNN